MMPFTRSKSGPRNCISVSRHISNRAGSTASSKIRTLAITGPWRLSLRFAGAEGFAAIIEFAAISFSRRICKSASLLFEASRNQAGSAPPSTTVLIGTPGAKFCSCCVNASWPNPERSVFVSKIRSATATCFTASKWDLRAFRPLTESTAVNTEDNSYSEATASSPIMVCRIGAGSAMPVVSTITRSNQRTPSRANRHGASFKVLTRSERIEQQMQPLLTATNMSSSIGVSNSWSNPTSPNSLTRISVLSNAPTCPRWRKTVVLPLPKKPVMIDIGIWDI